MVPGIDVVNISCTNASRWACVISIHDLRLSLARVINYISEISERCIVVQDAVANITDVWHDMSYWDDKALFTFTHNPYSTCVSCRSGLCWPCVSDWSRKKAILGRIDHWRRGSDDMAIFRSWDGSQVCGNGTCTREMFIATFSAMVEFYNLSSYSLSWEKLCLNNTSNRKILSRQISLPWN